MFFVNIIINFLNTYLYLKIENNELIGVSIALLVIKLDSYLYQFSFVELRCPPVFPYSQIGQLKSPDLREKRIFSA